MDFLPGAMIGGKYRLERKIAEGGVGEVWIGVDQKSRRVAIKRLLADTGKDRELVARFRREAVLLGKLQSEYVSQVIEQITDPKFGLLLVMEFVDGESLADLLDKRRKVPVPEVIAIGVDIARAIGVLHEANIIHRDLKPENVILRRLSGGGTKAVLIDFGFARLDPHGQGKRPNDDALTGITRADTMLGTVAYMAPEQVLNSRDVGRPADVYALGAILFRAMTGRHVFGDLEDIAYARAKLDGEAPPMVLDRINATGASAAKIIMKALKRRPADRYDRIETMQKELEALGNAAPVADDADAPTQSASVAQLLGPEAINIVKTNLDGARSQTDRVVVNVASPAASPDPSPSPAATAAAPDESSVTRQRQPGVKTIPIATPNPLALPPPPPLTAAPALPPPPPLGSAPTVPAPMAGPTTLPSPQLAALQAAALQAASPPAAPPPSLRLAPPPVPPKLPPMAAAPGVDDDMPAHLRNTGRHRPIMHTPIVAMPGAAMPGAAMPGAAIPGADEDLPAHLRATGRNRAVAAPAPNAPGVDDEVPAYLRNTSRTRGIQAPPLPPTFMEDPKKNRSAGIPFGTAIASMAITLLAGLIAGWIIHASLSGVSPWEMPASNSTNSTKR